MNRGRRLRSPIYRDLIKLPPEISGPGCQYPPAIRGFHRRLLIDRTISAFLLTSVNFVVSVKASTLQFNTEKNRYKFPLPVSIPNSRSAFRHYYFIDWNVFCDILGSYLWSDRYFQLLLSILHYTECFFKECSHADTSPNPRKCDKLIWIQWPFQTPWSEFYRRARCRNYSGSISSEVSNWWDSVSFI